MDEGDEIVIKKQTGFKKMLYDYFGINDMVDNLQYRIQDLKKEKGYLERKIDRLEMNFVEKDKEYRELVDNKFEIHNDAVAVDFLNPDMVFVSIERIWDTNYKYPRTVIGYSDKEGKIQSWYLEISDDKHKALVLEFQSTLATKRMKGK